MDAAPRRRPTVVSLCCGAGGMDLGFFAAGFQVVYAADFNADAVATYRRNLGDHVEQADLTTLDPARVPDADVWVSGPPCQPFSSAGKRAGSHDPRDMWPHVLRLLEARRPPFAVFENVTGLLTWNGGAYLRSIEDRLRAAGYAVSRAVLDAADFGVPQRRKRVFLLCRLEGPPVVPPWPTHGNPRRLAARSMFDPAPRRPWVTVRQALGLGGRPAAGRLDRPAPVVTTAEGKGVGVSDDVRKRRAGAVLFGASEEDQARIIAQRNGTRAGHGSGASADQPSVSVATNPPRLRLVSKRQRSSAGADAPSVTVAADGREAFVRDGPAPTLPDAPAQTVDSSGELHRAGAHRGGEPSRGQNSPTFLRRLTVAECARLQAFPDWFAFVGHKTARYAQVGNAVPPLLAWHVANAVRAAIGLPAVPVPDVLAWYAAPRSEWAAGQRSPEPEVRSAVHAP